MRRGAVIVKCGVGLAGLAVVCLAAAQAPPQKPGPSLAANVPSAAAAFIELNDLASLPGRVKDAYWFQQLANHPLLKDKLGKRRGRLLKAVAEKMGVPAGPLVRDLFSRQMALVGLKPGEDRYGLIVCRPVNGYNFAALAKAAGAEPVASHQGVPILQAKAGYLMAEARGLVLLSKADLKDAAQTKWLNTAVACLAGKDKQTLDTQATYKAQVGKLPAGATVVVYVENPAAWHKARHQKLQQLAKKHPKLAARLKSRRARRRQRRMAKGPMSGAKVAAIGVYTRGGRATIEVRADVDRSKMIVPVGAPGSLDLVGKLPADTVFALGVRGDALNRYDAAMASVKKPEHKHLAKRVARASVILTGLTGVEDVRQEIAANIGAQKVIFIGRVPGYQLGHKPGFDVPVLGAVVELRDPKPVAEAATRLTQTVAAVANVVGAKKQVADVITVTKTACGHTTIQCVSLRPVLSKVTRCPLFHELELAWAVQGKHLVVATNAQYVKSVLTAMSGQSPQLKSTPAYRTVRGPASGNHLAVCQPQLASATIKTWLDYLAVRAPQWLSPQTWRKKMKRLPAGAPTPIQKLQGAQAVLSVIDAVGYRMQVQGNQLSATVEIVPIQGKCGLAIFECPNPFVFKGFELRATRSQNPELAEIDGKPLALGLQRWQNG